MSVFAIIVIVGIVVGFVGILALGLWHPSSARQVTTGGDERRWATQAAIEERDVAEMVDAQNESRRRRGKAEVSEEEIRELARQRQEANLDQARRDEQA